MADQFDIVQGADEVITFIVAAPDGSPAVNQFTGLEVLTVSIWLGGPSTVQPVSATTATWLSATDATAQIHLSALDTVNLTVGLWRCRVVATFSGKTQVLYECILSVQPSPGTTAALLTYCSYADLYRSAPWVQRVISSSDNMRGDLSDYRNQAYLWTNRQIMARARRIIDEQYRRHEPVLYVTQPDVPYGVDGGPWWGPSIYPDTTKDTQLQQIQSWLPAGLDLSDGTINQVNVYKSIEFMCETQIGQHVETETSYQDLAGKYRGQAWRLWSQYNVRLTSQDSNAYVLELVA
jgi:hypothetical protein